MIVEKGLRLLSKCLLLLACAGLVPPAVGWAAQPEPWRAIRVQGEASIHDAAGRTVPLVEGSRFEPGKQLSTGPAGRVVLARGATTITVEPNGRMRIPESGDDGVRTRILQAIGSLLFKVEKRTTQHFEVETPYLTAVVKGTTFTVSADEKASAVSVIEGAVEVTALGSGQVRLIRPGLTAVVSGRGGKSLSVVGEQKPTSGALDRGEPSDDAEQSERGEKGAAGDASSAAAGKVGRLKVMLGQTRIDIDKATMGLVKNAAYDGGFSVGDSANGSSGNGNAYGQGNGNPGGGNPGGASGSPGNSAFGQSRGIGNPGGASGSPGNSAFGQSRGNGNPGGVSGSPGNSAFGHSRGNGNAKSKGKGNKG